MDPILGGSLYECLKSSLNVILEFGKDAAYISNYEGYRDYVDSRERRRSRSRPRQEYREPVSTTYSYTTKSNPIVIKGTDVEIGPVITADSDFRIPNRTVIVKEKTTVSSKKELEKAKKDFLFAFVECGGFDIKSIKEKENKVKIVLEKDGLQISHKFVINSTGSS